MKAIANTYKIKETSLEQIEKKQMTANDFDMDDLDEVFANLKEQCQSQESSSDASKMDWGLLEKSTRLLSNAEASYFCSDVARMDFYQIDPSPFLRHEVPGYDPDAPSGEGAIDYDRTYSSIFILIEDLDGYFAAYLKDHAMGHIQPLGRCVYAYEPVDVPNRCSPEERSRIQITKRILPYLEMLCMSDEIKMPEEIYNYYHVIPDCRIPGIEDRLNDLVTVQEAAEMLGVSASRVKKMVTDKVLDGFKRDGRVWLSKTVVQNRVDYVAEHGKPTRGKARK